MIGTIKLLEFAIMVAFAFFTITQIIVPMIYGRPLFPLLRDKSAKADAEIAAVREEIAVAEKTAAVRKLKKEAKSAQRRKT